MQKIIELMFLTPVIFLVTLTTFGNFVQGQKVIVDADPGGDDAMALFMLLSRKSSAQVLGVTCSRGNAPVDVTTRNALLILKTANRMNIPVYMGSAHGTTHDPPFDGYFGQDGLGDVFVKPTLSQKNRLPAAQALVNTVEANPGAITLLCIGPLTNIAAAIRLDPAFLSRVRDLVVLGGSYKGAGDIKPGVEFNVYMDPEAAMAVFSRAPAGKITLVPVDTVIANAFPLVWRKNILGVIRSPFMTFLNQAERKSLGKYGNTWSAFDPMGAAIVLDRSIATGYLNARIQVLASGHMNLIPGPTNARIVTSVNKAKLQGLIYSHMLG